MSEGVRRFRAADGTEYEVTMEGPPPGMSGPVEVENAGGMLPEESVRIVFRSDAGTREAEYTGLSRVDDLSDRELERWLNTARSGDAL